MYRMKDIKDELLGQHKLKRVQNLVEAQMRRDYYSICKEAPWIDQRMQITADMSDEEYVMPSNCISDKLIVKSADDCYEQYFYRDEARIMESNDNFPVWYIKETKRQAADSGRGASVTHGSKTVTLPSAPTGLTTYTGEFIELTGAYGIYEISSLSDSTITLSETYYGPTIEGASGDERTGYSIRPAGTKVVALLDADQSADDTDAYIWYSALPPPLYRDDDPVFLPSRELVVYKVMSSMADSVNERREFANRYENELTKRKAENPTIMDGSNRPRSLNGGFMKYTSRIYSAR